MEGDESGEIGDWGTKMKNCVTDEERVEIQECFEHKSKELLVKVCGYLELTFQVMMNETLLTQNSLVVFSDDSRGTIRRCSLDAIRTILILVLACVLGCCSFLCADDVYGDLMWNLCADDCES